MVLWEAWQIKQNQGDDIDGQGLSHTATSGRVPVTGETPRNHRKNKRVLYPV